MKGCINTLLPTITRIVNLSFNEACIPEILKQSAVEPRIMKPMLDNELLSSYRPISNLRFISKAVEKVAADRLNCNLINNDPPWAPTVSVQTRPWHWNCTAFVISREWRSGCTCWEWVLDLFVSSSLWGSPRIRTWSSPILTIYTASLNDVLKRHHISYHFNAVESQTYICPFSHNVLVNLNTPNLRWKRAILISIVGG